jgi:hypothetical protein
MMVSDMYFRKGMTVVDIGKCVGGVTHQQISLVLKLAVEALTKSEWLFVPEGKGTGRRRKAVQA